MTQQAAAETEVVAVPPAIEQGAAPESQRSWRRGYVRRIALGDGLAACVAVAVGLLARFGTEAETLVYSQASLWAALALPFVWLALMLVSRSYEERHLFVGPEEFRRVFGAAAAFLAVLGTVSWALQLEVARGFVVIALPLATSLTLLQRYGQRRWLHRQRRRQRYLQTTLVVGHQAAVQALRQQLQNEAYHGYQVVGCCLPPGQTGRTSALHDLPVLGDLTEVPAVVERHRIDTVAVLPCPELDGPALRRLGWDLEKTNAELLLAPSVTEVVGTRVRIRPVCGLPLLHMERPELRGVRRLAKDVVDRVLAAVLLVVLAPIMTGIALAVRVSSPGPVLFRQERVGRDGRRFQMLKFRTMVDGAERMVSTLTSLDDGNGVLFKMHGDPRVTRVGRWLRRKSLDELPQLFNVLLGSMSLVGPRPPLAREVERYGADMHRRFLVKPGITGLWQISGRSDLSWDDSVRLDVRYVENWSLMFDFMIMWKTVGAVAKSKGAY
ncbi:sugar transferase [Geodermatophilus sp. SYSU D00815]